MSSLDPELAAQLASSVQKIGTFLDRTAPDAALPRAQLRRCLNEAWFSETLAWLLDPGGSHGFGVAFLQAFVRQVARHRCGQVDPSTTYARRQTHLKFGKEGKGRGVSTLRLADAAVLREFFLARGIGRKTRGAQYCDLVVLDLDSGDSFMLVVENKLFTMNRPGQLKGYLDAVEERYSRAHTREYVYLTLDGRPPHDYPDPDTPSVYDRWVCLSWTRDIFEILRGMPETGNEEVAHLHALLDWLCRLLPTDSSDLAITTDDVAEYLHLVLQASGQRLLQELQRIGDGGKGEWSLQIERSVASPGSRAHVVPKHVVLVHSGTRSKLYVEMLPNFSITAQSRTAHRTRFEKIVVPFGAPADQVFNLLDIGARDIYHGHFDKPAERLGPHRRRRLSARKREEELLPLYRFQHKRRYELRALLTCAEHVWEASRAQAEREAAG